MSTARHDSGMEFERPRVPLGGQPSGDGSPAAEDTIRLDGDVLACACPDCGAPMSIRLWLMVADCFRCGASVELSEEQEQEAFRLLREQEQAKRAESRAAVDAIVPTVSRKVKPRPTPETASPQKEPSPPEREVSRPSPSTPPATMAVADSAAATVSRQGPRRVAAALVHRGARARVRDIHEKGEAAVVWGDLFKELPSWLVSLVFHLVLMLLLALWTVEWKSEGIDVVLETMPREDIFATAISEDHVAGDSGTLEDVLLESFEFEDGGAIDPLEAIEDILSPADPGLAPDVPKMPGDTLVRVGELPSDFRSPSTEWQEPVTRMFQGRNPQARTQTVLQEGGTSETEAAVARGLKFLLRHQRQDGSWSLHRFHKTEDCDETCRGHGSTHSDVAATALSLLPFLGAGQTHQEGEYAAEIFRGLKWLVEQQKENGDLRDGGQMYAHGQAAIALCEAYALSGDQELRQPAQTALNYIVRAQHRVRGGRGGGWRYNPGEAGDTSVVGWQLMALKSGQMAYLHVPAKTFEGAGTFLDSVVADQAKIGAEYTYQPGGRSSPAMTAEALLCRQYLGWSHDEPGLRWGVEYLLDRLPDAEKPNVYYWYYATQVMHHYGGQEWEKWNRKMRQMLVDLQETKGHAAGSWAPRGRGVNGGLSERGGRIYMTALAICILEVYYRHMPIYGRGALEGFQ